MKKTLFTGSGVALVTPFKDDCVDYEALDNLIDFHLENKTDAIIICGTTGEASTMPDSEHISVISHTVKKVAGKIPVIAGTGSNDTSHGIELSKSAEKAGADGLLLVTPYYNKTTQKGLVAHFSAIAKAVNIPIILYNVPSRTGMNISISAISELYRLDNIVAIKEASGNISYTAEIAAKFPELDIYSGNDDMIVPVLSLGGKGVISVVANILPRETHDMCENYFKGNTAEATKEQLKMFDLVAKLFCEVNPIPVKTALNIMGKNAGKLRLPLCEMADENFNALKKAMLDYGMKL